MIPFLGWVNLERTKKTFENTTQWYRDSVRLPFCHHFKSCFPAANVPRLHENVVTDTFFLDVPAHDDGVLSHGGATMVDLYCGKDSQLTRGYPMTSEHDMSTHLRIIFAKMVPLMLSSVTTLRLRLERMFSRSCACTASPIFSVNLTTKTRTMLSAGFRRSRRLSMLSWIAPVLLLLTGFLPCSMSST
jgi:hypothetical protein